MRTSEHIKCSRDCFLHPVCVAHSVVSLLKVIFLVTFQLLLYSSTCATVARHYHCTHHNRKNVVKQLVICYHVPCLHDLCTTSFVGAGRAALELRKWTTRCREYVMSPMNRILECRTLWTNAASAGELNNPIVSTCQEVHWPVPKTSEWCCHVTNGVNASWTNSYSGLLHNDFAPKG